MKKALKVLLNHSILILSSITVLIGELILRILYPYDLLFAMVVGVVIIASFFFDIFTIVYAILFFRRENFLTLLLPFGLIYSGKAKYLAITSMYMVFIESKHFLFTFFFCLILRTTAIILIRIYKAKLQNWTGEEKITSDVVFWVKVLFKKLMESIKPKSNI